MRYAIFTDVHSHPYLLEDALKEARSKGAKKILCLGDTTGYGPEPNETLELVRENVDHYVLGNHDMASMELLDSRYWSNRAAEWHEEFDSSIEGHLIDWLHGQPMEKTVDEVVHMVHGSPSAPDSFHYFDYLGKLQILREFRALSLTGAKVCFVGHSHQSTITTMNEKGEISKTYYQDSNKVKLKDPAIITAGSVGEPRDGGYPSFAIYDSDSSEVELVRF